MSPSANIGSTPTVPATATLQGWRMWFAGARPKTLPAAIVPVLLGTAIADLEGRAKVAHAVLALVVSLALQVGVNYANDYSDGIRGTDDAAVRVGPPRLVGWKLASPKAVKMAALGSLGVAAVAGLVLAAFTTWWLVVVGAFAIGAAWGYTGGPRPYGYAGLGEIFVFCFFGLVAVVGTTYVQIRTFPASSWLAGALAGFLATALLIVNNLRDIPGDSVVGKQTLAVRLGDSKTRALYVGGLGAALVCVAGLAVLSSSLFPLLGLVGAAVGLPGVAQIRAGAKGRDLIPVLVRTGQAQLAVGTLTSLGLFLASL